MIGGVKTAIAIFHVIELKIK